MNVNTYLTESQKTVLERAKVGVAGLGGLGSNVLCHLLRAGVRRFVAADVRGRHGRRRRDEKRGAGVRSREPDLPYAPA